MRGKRTARWADSRTGRQRLLRMLRQLAGMPDYAAQVEHLRRCHPEQPVPSEAEFYSDFVRTRYGDGPTRCC
jgi:uncharacterized short protein YbdD (DUF466 family)